MKFSVWCKNKGAGDESAWEEKYDKDINDPNKWAEDTIAWYNRGAVKQSQPEREVVRVEITDTTPSGAEHVWEKSNLVTIRKGGETYDTAKCKV